MLCVVGVGFAVALGASEILLQTRFVDVDPLLAKASLYRRSKGGDAIFGDSRAFYGLGGIRGFTNQAFAGDSIAEIVGKMRDFYAGATGFRAILAIAPEPYIEAGQVDQLRVRQAHAVHFFEATSLPVPHALLDYFRARLPQVWGVFLRKGRFDPAPLGEDGAYLDPGVLTLPEQAAIDRMIGLQVEQAGRLRAFDASPQGRQMLALLQWLHDARAQVCLVTPPMHHRYSRELIASDRYAAFFRSVAREADRLGFRYLNDFHGDLPDSAYADAIHLNATGAALWSRRVAQACFGIAPDPG